jgi:hypothetical protein
MLALLTIGICAKLRVRALELGLGCLFRLSDCCLKLPRRHLLDKFGSMAASDSFLQPGRITRRKRGKRIQNNVHRIDVAGEI